MRNVIPDHYIVLLQENQDNNGMVEDDPINFHQVMQRGKKFGFEHFEKKMDVERLGESSTQFIREVKKIKGHVEDEELWKLRRCLVREMATVCSVNSIKSRPFERGMGEIKVHNMGGETSCFRSMTMVTCVPLHYWNQVTLTRLAKLWGKFEALGENAKHVIDCEKVPILVTTTKESRISEVVEIEVGNLCYVVRVEEMGFTDKNSQPWVEFSKHQEGQAKAQYGDDRFSVASSNSSKKPLPSSSVIHQEVEDDELDIYSRVVEDVQDMGFSIGQEKEKEKERQGVMNSVGGNSLWARLVDKTANAGFVEVIEQIPGRVNKKSDQHRDFFL
ncbi:hypothetical protein GQ457_01G015920 [Hibiscus cannabinus]